MANIDGGHYFLTTLIPLKLEPIKRNDGSFTSPSHILREVLSTLPTALQSPDCLEAGFNSPFSRCTRTHFARLVVIDQPMYNGRDGGDALIQGLRNVNLLMHEPVDDLSRPYLMFCADFDAQTDEADGGLNSWAAGLWSTSESELRDIFASCWGFDAVNDGAAFAVWLKRCQLDTTMSFNDYYVPMPDLKGYTVLGVIKGIALSTVALFTFAWWGQAEMGISRWWLLAAALVAAILSISGALWLLWVKGSKPFPTGANTSLLAVLKALHVQQRFALLVSDLQGVDNATLHNHFGAFLQQVQPANIAAPTQSPGVIRSDGISLVVHKRVAQKGAVV